MYISIHIQAYTSYGYTPYGSKLMGMDVHSISTAPYVAPAPSPRAAASSCDDPSWRHQSSGLETSKPLPRVTPTIMSTKHKMHNNWPYGDYARVYRHVTSRLHNLDGKLQIKHWLTELQIRFFPPFPVRVRYYSNICKCCVQNSSKVYYLHILSYVWFASGFLPAFYRALITCFLHRSLPVAQVAAWKSHFRIQKTLKRSDLEELVSFN